MRQRFSRAAGCEQFLGEERVPRRPGDDGVELCRGRSSVGVVVEQRSEIGVGQRRQFDDERCLAAAHAFRQPDHAFRSRLCGATRRDEHHRHVDDVVGQEDDEVERRDVGPVQILQHDQQWVDRGALRQQRQHGLEHLQLRTPDLVTERVPERTQRVDEQLERQLDPDDVDRPAQQHLKGFGAGRCGNLGRQSRLADAGVARHEHGRSSARACEIEALDHIGELALASDEDSASARAHGREPRAPAWCGWTNRSPIGRE